MFSRLSVFHQVIPLDITVELQKQIMSELEILYKVGSRILSLLHLGDVAAEGSAIVTV